MVEVIEAPTIFTFEPYEGSFYYFSMRELASYFFEDFNDRNRLTNIDTEYWFNARHPSFVTQLKLCKIGHSKSYPNYLCCQFEGPEWFVNWYFKYDFKYDLSHSCVYVRYLNVK